jgi:glycosyltransferase involved in cell wall biosynthesis
MILSLITAVYQDKNNLIGLIDSIRVAKRPGVEWIVIDGGSKDGTLELIKNSGEVINRFISEPDSGIYDAWNKGLKISSGRYIVFLGADDRVSSDYFDLAIAFCDGSANTILFPTAYVKENKIVRVVNLNSWQRPLVFPVRFNFPHSGTIQSRELFDFEKFDTSYRISGDFEFLVRNFDQLSIKLVKCSKPKVFFSLLGISESGNKLGVYLELLRIYKIHKKKSFWFYVYTGIIYVKLYIRLIL